MERMSELVHLLVSYAHRHVYGRMALLALLLVVGSTLALLSGTPFSTTPTVHAATDCAAQNEIPQAECEALLALYTATDGPNWSNNTGWNDTNTPCSWQGVTCAAGSVSRLSLIDNGLNGSIPSELGNLSNLTELGLGGNQLSGSIPPELSSLSSLSFLGLYQNQLSGSIPPELGNLSNLTDLALGGNALSGSIPPELGNLSNLQALGLGGNQLSGSIPPELGTLSNLGWLSLSNNQLSGNIPPELGNLSSLSYLYLSNNQLSGSIPPELANMTSISTAALGNNYLDTTVTDQALLDWLNTNSTDWMNQRDPESLIDNMVYIPFISR